MYLIVFNNKTIGKNIIKDIKVYIRIWGGKNILKIFIVYNYILYCKIINIKIYLVTCIKKNALNIYYLVYKTSVRDKNQDKKCKITS